MDLDRMLENEEFNEIEALRERVKELEAECNGFVETNCNIGNLNSEYLEEIDKLEKENAKLEERITELKSTITNCPLYERGIAQQALIGKQSCLITELVEALELGESWMTDLLMFSDMVHVDLKTVKEALSKAKEFRDTEGGGK